MKMNKREAISLGLFLVSIFLIGIVLFSGINKEVTIKMEGGKSIKSDIPANFPILTTLFLMVLSGVASCSFYDYMSDFSKKFSLSNKQRISINMLEGDVKNVYMYLLEKQECLQKDLIYELQLPKAKVTRILDKLSQKGLVKRISYGKTNKIVIE